MSFAAGSLSSFPFLDFFVLLTGRIRGISPAEVSKKHTSRCNQAACCFFSLSHPEQAKVRHQKHRLTKQRLTNAEASASHSVIRWIDKLRKQCPHHHLKPLSIQPAAALAATRRAGPEKSPCKRSQELLHLTAQSLLHLETGKMARNTEQQEQACQLASHFNVTRCPCTHSRRLGSISLAGWSVIGILSLMAMSTFGQ